jgi:hypothetical protein
MQTARFPLPPLAELVADDELHRSSARPTTVSATIDRLSWYAMGDARLVLGNPSSLVADARPARLER